MERKKLTNSETRVTEVISFILEQYRNEKVNQDMEVCSELILIARILHQRFRISNGTQVKEDQSVQVAKNEVLKEIKDDEYYILIKNFIKDYREFREKNIKKILNWIRKMKTKPIRTIDQLSAKEIEDCACSDLEKYFVDVTSIKEIAKRSTIKETGYVDILLFSERLADSRVNSEAIRTDKEPNPNSDDFKDAWELDIFWGEIIAKNINKKLSNNK